jgi:hypothetical protein
MRGPRLRAGGGIDLIREHSIQGELRGLTSRLSIPLHMVASPRPFESPKFAPAGAGLGEMPSWVACRAGCLALPTAAATVQYVGGNYRVVSLVSTDPTNQPTRLPCSVETSVPRTSCDQLPIPASFLWPVTKKRWLSESLFQKRHIQHFEDFWFFWLPASLHP